MLSDPTAIRAALAAHREAALACTACPTVHPPAVIGPPAVSRVFLLGQAPGPREAGIGHPFAWTAGRTLFRWFAGLGVDEATFRERVYMAAVLRCFPGKATPGPSGKAGGDRVPAPAEIERCSRWLAAEVALLQPRLVLAIGRLAIEQVGGAKVRRMEDVVGPVHHGRFHGVEVDWIALPHPSGVSAWPKVEPGRTHLATALAAVAAHPAWGEAFPAGR